MMKRRLRTSAVALIRVASSRPLSQPSASAHREFRQTGTQDYHFGNDFAEKIGSVHERIPKEKGDNIPDYSSLMAKAWEGSNHGQWPAERPQLAWSGEGGSGVLGGVGLSESVVALMRAGSG